MPGKVYLIPNSLGSENPDSFLPAELIRIIPGLNFYIVENIRNARRFLKLVNREVDIDAITFFELNKHTDPAEIESFLKPVLDGNDIGILSEAGLPGIADPGAAVVRMAHQRKLNVVPFVGPSSIFLALMASGLNGQSFRFTGYLPIRTSERVQAIRNLEQRAHKEDETQIFIETPYRNNSLLDDLLSTCGNQTLLTIAADISTESEFIQTASIEGWKKKKPDLHKRPAVFLIGI